MGLYQLAGPFPVTKDDGTYPTGFSADLWWPHVGLLAHTNFDGPAVMAIDGLCCFQARFSFNFGTNLCFWPEKNLLVGMSQTGFAGGLYSAIEQSWEPRVWMTGYTPDQPEGTVYPPQLVTGTYIKQNERRIYHNGDDVLALPNSSLVPVTLAANVLPFTPECIRVGRHARDVMFPSHGASGNGAAVFFDTDTLEVSKQYFIGEAYYFKYLFYLPEFQVFLTVHQVEDKDWVFEIKIWSMEVCPTIITEPEVVEGEVKPGQVVTFRVQVTGNKDDPAENELVNWVSSGDTGTLLDTQTTTDVDGYAYVDVEIPIGATGDVVLEASVQC